MLRNRILDVKQGKVTLVTYFEPSPSSDDLSEEFCAVRLSFDKSKKTPLLVEKLKSPDTLVPIPPLYLIAEEIGYLFHLLKTLQPYETQEKP